MVSFLNCIQGVELLDIFRLSPEPLVTEIRSIFGLNYFDVGGIPKASLHAPCPPPHYTLFSGERRVLDFLVFYIFRFGVTSFLVTTFCSVCPCLIKSTMHRLLAQGIDTWFIKVAAVTICVKCWMYCIVSSVRK